MRRDDGYNHRMFVNLKCPYCGLAQQAPRGPCRPSPPAHNAAAPWTFRAPCHHHRLVTLHRSRATARRARPARALSATGLLSSPAAPFEHDRNHYRRGGSHCLRGAGSGGRGGNCDRGSDQHGVGVCAARGFLRANATRGSSRPVGKSELQRGPICGLVPRIVGGQDQKHQGSQRSADQQQPRLR